MDLTLVSKWVVICLITIFWIVPLSPGIAKAYCYCIPISHTHKNQFLCILLFPINFSISNFVHATTSLFYLLYLYSTSSVEQFLKSPYIAGIAHGKAIICWFSWELAGLRWPQLGLFIYWSWSPTERSKIRFI